MGKPTLEEMQKLVPGFVPESLRMSDYKIRVSYRDAKNKNNQIRILADLNLCSKQAILDILTVYGELSGVKTRSKAVGSKEPQRRGATKTPPVQWTTAEDARLRELYQNGTKCLSIAEMMGRSESSIKNRVNVLKLSRPKKSGAALPVSTPQFTLSEDICRVILIALNELFEQKNQEWEIQQGLACKISDEMKPIRAAICELAGWIEKGNI